MGYREQIQDTQVNPLTSITGAMVFSVADRAIESDNPLVLNFYNNDGTITYRLR